jgi:hypothetical protein
MLSNRCAVRATVGITGVNMKLKNLLFTLPLAALGLGGLLLTGCAVAGQPMAKRGGGWGSPVSAAQEQPGSTKSLSMFAAKKVAAEPAAEPEPARVWKAAPKADAQPAPQVAAEPASGSQPEAAAEPTPESQTTIAAESAPKKRGPLTRSEENEIDNQVMP